MRSRFVSFGAGVLLAISLGALAQVSGVPQRLRVQSVGVNTTAPAAGNITATGTITGATVTATGTLSGATVSATGTLSAPTINATSALQIGGVALNTIPKTAYGSIAHSGGACALAGATRITSCSHIGAGLSGVNLAAAAFTATPTCQATLSGLGESTTSTISIGSVAGSAPNYTLNVQARKNGAALADSNYFVMCMGV